MSGSEGNAFSDLLRVLLGEGVDFAWIALGAGALSALAALAAALVATRAMARLERRMGLAPRPPEPGGRVAAACAWAGAFGALALWPIAPHVFFADLDRSALAMVALLLFASTGPVIGMGLGMALGLSRGSGERQAAAEAAGSVVAACAAALAIGGGLLAAGSGNLIAASRAQAGWWGLGWTAFTDPFALIALVAWVAARAGDVARRGTPAFTVERVAAFAWSLLAATVFLGGFESPLSFLLRRSLGEDPGFLNHEVLASGATATHVDWGGFLFQGVAAATLLAKALLLEVACAATALARFPGARRLAGSWSARLALAVVGLCGAGWAAWLREAAQRIGER